MTSAYVQTNSARRLAHATAVLLASRSIPATPDYSSTRQSRICVEDATLPKRQTEARVRSLAIAGGPPARKEARRSSTVRATIRLLCIRSYRVATFIGGSQPAHRFRHQARSHTP